MDGLTSGADPDVEGTPAAFAAAAVRTSAAGARAPEEVITRAAVDISRYESGVAEETGFASLRFTHHIITDAGSWFCMKVDACTTPAEGFEETVHFNYNAETGRFTGLRDLFPEGTDYITPISESIRAQMRSRMEEDPDQEYWLDAAPENGQVFETISPRQDFYIDEDGTLVICFDEMEAAPMYMGTLEFRIPEEVTQAAGISFSFTGSNPIFRFSLFSAHRMLLSAAAFSLPISFRCFSFSAMANASLRSLFSHQDEKFPACTSMVFRFRTSTWSHTASRRSLS